MLLDLANLGVAVFAQAAILRSIQAEEPVAFVLECWQHPFCRGDVGFWRERYAALFGLAAMHVVLALVVTARQSVSVRERTIWLGLLSGFSVVQALLGDSGPPYAPTLLGMDHRIAPAVVSCVRLVLHLVEAYGTSVKEKGAAPSTSTSPETDGPAGIDSVTKE